MKTARFLVPAAFALMGACASPRVLNVTPVGQGTADAPCLVEVDGVRMPVDAFPAFARRGREAHIAGSVETPYRCFGRIIFELQRAGFERIGFVSGPAPETVR